jgi:hypothetical protein
MNSFTSLKLSKLWLFALPYLAIFAWTLYFSVGEDWRYQVVTSDGRGYYAYLPAIFVFNDPSYESVKNAERASYEHGIAQTYVFNNEAGRQYNKYYPGVAVLQTPFFLAGLGISYLIGQPVTGYSDASLLMVIFASLCYALAGFYFFQRALKGFGFSSRETLGLSTLIYFGSQVFYQTLALPSFSHNYSFFLFACFIVLIQRLIDQPSRRDYFLLGLTFGLILVVRPTNGLLLFFIPFLAGDPARLKTFFAELFTWSNRFLISGILGGILSIMLLPILWKWQVGSWILWSYHGEGFNFLHPRIWETLWSYRIGLFVHTPITLLAVFGLIELYRRSTYQFWTWLGYFSLLLFVISSWWCWDYESNFGHRALTEHMLIFAFPLGLLMRKMNTKLFWSIGLVVVGLATMRAYQKVSGIFTEQRFSALTYWKSMGDLDRSVKGKYEWLLHCHPFGNVFEKTELIFPENEFQLSKDRQFSEGVMYNFPVERFRNRFFFEVEFDKKLLNPEEDWKDVLLVFDATNERTGERNYYASPIHTYFKEGNTGWHETLVQNEIPVEFNPMEKVSVYFWNLGQKSVAMRNVRMTVTEYAVP